MEHGVVGHMQHTAWHDTIVSPRTTVYVNSGCCMEAGMLVRDPLPTQKTTICLTVHGSVCGHVAHRARAGRVL